MAGLKNRIAIMLTLFVTLTSLHCSKTTSSTGTSGLIGTWQVTQLILNGIDTLPGIKRDSTCFPKIRFYINQNDQQRMETLSGFNVPDSIFFCRQFGSWGFGAGHLNVIWAQPVFNTGPFLSSSAVDWAILSQTETEIKLHTNNNGDDCYLSLAKD